MVGFRLMGFVKYYKSAWVAERFKAHEGVNSPRITW